MNVRSQAHLGILLAFLSSPGLSALPSAEVQVQPVRSLASGPDGRLFGLRGPVRAESGGEGDTGAILVLARDGSLSELHAFSGPDGALPEGRLLDAGDGYLYGVTSDAGVANAGEKKLGAGTVFRLRPDGSGFQTLHSFSGTGDGGRPKGGLASHGGVLYGVTSQGGPGERGTIFRLRPGSPVGVAGGSRNPRERGLEPEVVYAFRGEDGWDPQAALLPSRDGLLYGTTRKGGAHGLGTAFRLDPDRRQVEVLHSFGPGEGILPQATLVEGPDGALYGVTRHGNPSFHGTVFRVGKDGAFRTLHTFVGFHGSSTHDGSFPLELTLGSDGFLWGVTAEGGQENAGSVFRLRPDGSGYEVVHSFAAGEDPSTGLTPQGGGGLLLASRDETGVRLRDVLELAGEGAERGASTRNPLAPLATFVVNSAADPGDGTCDASCTLRDAILAANAAAGPHTITFAIGAVGSQQTIPLLTTLPVIVRQVLLDGWSQGGAGYTGPPLVELDGAAIPGSPGPFGLHLTTGSSGSSVRGLALNRFPAPGGNGFGILVIGSAANTWIHGCYFGVGLDGVTNRGNGQGGIWFHPSAAPSHLVGTNADGVNDAAERNVFAANVLFGVLVQTPSVTLAGNHLGTNAAGMAALGAQLIGIENTSTGTVIGGLLASQRNVLSGGNQAGVRNGAGADGAVIRGNYIGLAADGTTPLGNLADGIQVNNAAGIVIGDGNPGGRNLISSNAQVGLQLNGLGTAGTFVSGNYIGLDVSGTLDRGNVSTGVRIQNQARNNRIGSSGDPAERNVIANNDRQGNAVVGNNANVQLLGPVQGNTVAGNFVGLNAAGLASFVPHGGMRGIMLVGGATDSVIGGLTGSTRNVVGSLGHTGIELFGGASSNWVLGNWTGLDTTAALATVASYGIAISSGGTGNLFGSDADGVNDAAERNVVAGGNRGIGILASNGNTVAGNYLGLGPDGLTSIPNTGISILVQNAQSNVIGGTTAAARNVLGGPGTYTGTGIRLIGATASGNQVQGNYVGVGADGTTSRGFGFGIYVDSGATNNVIGGATLGHRNVVSGCHQGVNLFLNGTNGNVVQGNLIGRGDDAGVAPRPAVWSGPLPPIVRIGDPAPNVPPSLQAIVGNGNIYPVLLGFGASNGNLIGGTNPGEGNLVVGNASGITVQSQALNNRILGNSIYGNTVVDPEIAVSIGIDLSAINDVDGPTPNDPCDVDSGVANNYQNKPTLDVFLPAGQVQGNLNSTASTTYRLEFFASTTASSSGFGEGEKFVGTMNVTTDALCSAPFVFNFVPVPGKPFITATATNLTTGDTSEFSRVAASDLATTKTAPANGTAGADVTYTVTVTNQGGTAAQDVSVSDTIPASTRFVSATPSAGFTSLVTPAVGGSGTVTATWAGSTASASSRTLTIVVRACPELTCGQNVSNTATATSTFPPDANLLNNTSPAATFAAQRASDLSVTAVDAPDPVGAGFQVTYTLTVNNAGPSFETDALASLALPAGWLVVSATPSQGACVGTGTGTATCNLGTLGAPNPCGAALTQTATVTVVAQVPAGEGVGPKTATASVGTSNCLADPNLANNSVPVVTTVSTDSDMTLTKIDTPDPVTAGRDVDYTLNVTNLGPATAFGVIVTDTLPAGARFKSVRPPVGWTCTTPYPGTTGGTVTCTTSAAILPGTVALGIKVQSPPVCNRNVTIVNTATVGSSTPDPTPANNTATASTLVQGGLCFF